MLALVFLAGWLWFADQPLCDIPTNMIQAQQCQVITEQRARAAWQ